MVSAALVLAAALDLGAMFAEKGAWSEKSEFFAVEHAKEGFSFASENRDVVNCLNHDTCTWHGIKVWEARVFFDKSGEEERITRVELSLYNRGDAGLSTMDIPVDFSSVFASFSRIFRRISEKLCPVFRLIKSTM